LEEQTAREEKTRIAMKEIRFWHANAAPQFRGPIVGEWRSGYVGQRQPRTEGSVRSPGLFVLFPFHLPSNLLSAFCSRLLPRASPPSARRYPSLPEWIHIIYIFFVAAAVQS